MKSIGTFALDGLMWMFFSQIWSFTISVISLIGTGGRYLPHPQFLGKERKVVPQINVFWIFAPALSNLRRLPSLPPPPQIFQYCRGPNNRLSNSCFRVSIKVSFCIIKLSFVTLTANFSLALNFLHIGRNLNVFKVACVVKIKLFFCGLILL